MLAARTRNHALAPRRESRSTVAFSDEQGQDGRGAADSRRSGLFIGSHDVCRGIPAWVQIVRSVEPLIRGWLGRVSVVRMPLVFSRTMTNSTMILNCLNATLSFRRPRASHERRSALKGLVWPSGGPHSVLRSRHYHAVPQHRLLEPACTCLPVRQESLPRPRWQWATRGRLPGGSAGATPLAVVGLAALGIEPVGIGRDVAEQVGSVGRNPKLSRREFDHVIGQASVDTQTRPVADT